MDIFLRVETVDSYKYEDDIIIRSYEKDEGTFIIIQYDTIWEGNDKIMPEIEVIDLEDGRKCIVREKNGSIALTMPEKETNLSTNDVLFLISYLSRVAGISNINKKEESTLREKIQDAYVQGEVIEDANHFWKTYLKFRKEFNK